MARALIIIPDPQTPGGVGLTELHNLAHVRIEVGGVLAVQSDEDGEPVYYGPGAWHSFTRGELRLMPD